MLIAVLVAVFALTMFLGVPIALCLGLGGLAFIVLSGVVPIAVLPTLMFAGMDSFPLLAIPFFVIAGDVMQRCGVLPKLMEFANSLVGHLRGGLGYVVVLTSMLFAGVTGVALAECAAIGAMVGPSMVRQGYPGGFTSAVIAGSAVMGPIIPPSVAMLVFAYVYGGGGDGGVVRGPGGRVRAAHARAAGSPGEPHDRGQDERDRLPAARHVERGVLDPGAEPGPADGGPLVARPHHLPLHFPARHHRGAVRPGDRPRGDPHHDHADPGAGPRGDRLQDRPAPPRPDRGDDRPDRAPHPAGGPESLRGVLHREVSDGGGQSGGLGLRGRRARRDAADRHVAGDAPGDSPPLRLLTECLDRSSPAPRSSPRGGRSRTGCGSATPCMSPASSPSTSTATWSAPATSASRLGRCSRTCAPSWRRRAAPWAT